MNTKKIEMDRLLLRPVEVAETLGIGRSKGYELIASWRRTVDLDLEGACVVPVEKLREWINRRAAATRMDG